ncbi:tetratricopeptide repeat protein [Tautonia rosea]|uniref:tetratricopeptide repeat protein n=1 Tax=Tautonia rosea TaxID=2728037 RepID=UPI0014755477|nr:tetratricopeptide repeat protein [Tautonia rosea]
MSARILMILLFVVMLVDPSKAARLQDDRSLAQSEGVEPSVPPAFTPYASLLGRWKGQAVPADNPLRGWRESHEWSYAFQGGEPVGLTLTIEGGKILASARITFDEASETYRLEGTDPEGTPVVYVGTRDEKTNALTLDRSGPAGDDRLTIRPNANGIRSDFWFDRKEPGSPQFARLVRANLGKEGENFAGGAAVKGPECIVTGGAATITVSAGGSTFAVCCSGCRDEVLANPEKYARKLRASLTSSRPAASPAPSSEPADTPQPDLTETPPSPKPKTDDPAPSDAETRRKAASLLRLGQSLERQGKADGALTFYRRVVDEAPGTPEAATAAARIKALSGDE